MKRIIALSALILGLTGSIAHGAWNVTFVNESSIPVYIMTDEPLQPGSAYIRTGLGGIGGKVIANGSLAKNMTWAWRNMSIATGPKNENLSTTSFAKTQDFNNDDLKKMADAAGISYTKNSWEGHPILQFKDGDSFKVIISVERNDAKNPGAIRARFSK